MSDQEIFKPIEGFPAYQISNFGNVQRFKDGQWVTLNTTGGAGYPIVSLSENGHRTTKAVHRLVAKYFLPEPAAEAAECVRHLDGNKKNNRADNLAWGTHKQNCEDSKGHPQPDNSGMLRLTCLRCGHSWMPRVERVRLCPACHSPYWFKPRRQPAAISQ